MSKNVSQKLIGSHLVEGRMEAVRTVTPHHQVSRGGPTADQNPAPGSPNALFTTPARTTHSPADPCDATAPVEKLR